MSAFSNVVKAAPGLAHSKDVVVRGLRFRLIETESRWPGRGDRFILREREVGKFHEEFCGFRSFADAEEFLATSAEVAVWAGFTDSKVRPAPTDRAIEALGFLTWQQPAGTDDEGAFSACGGSDPFTGRVRWCVSDGWAGWVWAGSGLVVSPGIDDRVVVSFWKEIGEPAEEAIK